MHFLSESPNIFITMEKIRLRQCNPPGILFRPGRHSGLPDGVLTGFADFLFFRCRNTDVAKNHPFCCQYWQHLPLFLATFPSSLASPGRSESVGYVHFDDQSNQDDPALRQRKQTRTQQSLPALLIPAQIAASQACPAIKNGPPQWQPIC